MTEKYELIICLGGGISQDGTLPLWVTRRLNKAIELYGGKVCKKLLMSGKGRNNFEHTEADAMKYYLMRAGVSVDDILKEGTSTDTIQNAFFSKISHVDPLEIKSFIVVTSEFHMERTQGIFRRVFREGYKIRYESASDEDLDPKDLQKRAVVEQRLIEFNEKVLFPAIKSNYMAGFNSFIHNNDHVLAREYQKVIGKIKDKMALY